MVVSLEGMNITSPEGCCVKPKATGEAVPEVKSYNLRPRKNSESVKWPDMPVKGSEGIQEFKLPVDFKMVNRSQSFATTAHLYRFHV